MHNQTLAHRFMTLWAGRLSSSDRVLDRLRVRSLRVSTNAGAASRPCVDVRRAVSADFAGFSSTRSGDAKHFVSLDLLDGYIGVGELKNDKGRDLPRGKRSRPGLMISQQVQRFPPPRRGSGLKRSSCTTRTSDRP
jgi:hypothetical protein